jgi:quercetin dioxygenase-like cupin family protein
MSVKHSEDLPRVTVQAGTGTERQVLIGPDEGPNFALRRFIMQPGGGMPNHTNTVEHEQYVLRGSATIGIGGETREVRQGDVVFIPAGTPHWYRAHAGEPFEFLCIVPNAEDRIEVLGEGG